MDQRPIGMGQPHADGRPAYSLGYFDGNRVETAFCLVVLAQPRAKPYRLGPHDCIHLRVVIRPAVEDLQRNHRFLQLVVASFEVPFDEKPEKARLPFVARERGTRKRPFQRLPRHDRVNAVRRHRARLCAPFARCNWRPTPFQLPATCAGYAARGTFRGGPIIGDSDNGGWTWPDVFDRLSATEQFGFLGTVDGVVSITGLRGTFDGDLLYFNSETNRNEPTWYCRAKDHAVTLRR